MASKAEKMDVTIVNSVTLGDRWGITDRRVRQLKDEGVIEEVARGKYNFFECNKRYITFLRQAAETGCDKKQAKLDKDEQQAMHEKVKREKSELQLKIMKGELHKSEDVEMVMTDMIANAKSKLLGIPSKAAPMVMGYKEIPKVQAVLQRLIEESLIDLSDYTTELFKNDDVLKDDSDD